MKIGILTYHSSHNYGAFLQAYALCEALRERTGHDVEIINYSMRRAVSANRQNILFNKRYPATVVYNLWRYEMFNKASPKYHQLSNEKLVTDDLQVFASWLEGKYDAIIVGSDEVWKLDGYRGFPNPYWLPDVKGCKKMAYAASSRTAPERITGEMKEKVGQLLKTFSYVGVRDMTTKAVIESALPVGGSCNLNCDPTFLYDFKVDKDICREFVRKRFKVSDNKKCVALMIGEPKLAYAIIEKYGEKFNFISLYEYYGTKGFYVPDPFSWIKAISGVSGLVTTFFHGMVFAIKSNTPFLAIENRELSDVIYSKSYDLLHRNHLENHFAYLYGATVDMWATIDDFFDKISFGDSGADFETVCADEQALSRSFIGQLINQH